MSDVLALRHVDFEHLGEFEPVLEARGLRIHYVDPASTDLTSIDPAGPALLCVLGGPIGAYEDDRYPWLAAEIEFVRRRLNSKRPLIGICLGAQLMARALGARVYPGPEKEIGWAPLTITQAGLATPLSALAEVPAMLHWHGDTFDLPAGCETLASTRAVPNQAFAMGRHALALQFHPEICVDELERWLVGHACELSVNGIDPRKVRADAEHHGAALARASREMLSQWLDAAGVASKNGRRARKPTDRH